MGSYPRLAGTRFDLNRLRHKYYLYVKVILAKSTQCIYSKPVEIIINTKHVIGLNLPSILLALKNELLLGQPT